MAPRLAITGSSGKFGRHIISLATSEGLEIQCIDASDSESLPPNAIFIKTNLREYSNVVDALRGCDRLIHLAAIPNPRGRNDWDVHNNNVVVSYNVLRAAAEVGIKRISLASSANAVGGVFSRNPKFDYFPIDEEVTCRAEDPYSLSKWIAEAQCSAISRRFDIRIASLRIHHCVDAPAKGDTPENAAKDLWGYVLNGSAAKAFMLGLTSEGWEGHETFYVVSHKQGASMESQQLWKENWPEVPLRDGFQFNGHEGFFDCSKAKRLLGWTHEEVEESQTEIG